MSWRLLMYFKKLQTQFQKYHVVVLSIIIWMVGSAIFCQYFLQYGTNPSYSEQQCFEFYKDLKREEFIILNFSMIVIMMTTVVILFLIQMWVIVQLVKVLWPDMWTHQNYQSSNQELLLPPHNSGLFYAPSCLPDTLHSTLLRDRKFWG